MALVHGLGTLSDPHLAMTLRGGPGKTPAMTGLPGTVSFSASWPSPGQQAAVAALG